MRYARNWLAYHLASVVLAYLSTDNYADDFVRVISAGQEETGIRLANRYELSQ